MSEVPHYVYFHGDDYARIARRIPAMLIDSLVLFIVLLAIGTVTARIYVPPDVQSMPDSKEKRNLIAKHMRLVQVPTFGGWLVICGGYHIALRRRRIGTIGYALTGIRLIDAAGQSPGWKTLVKRFFIAVPFTLFFAATYWVCLKSPRRQTFHDRCAGTWMIRRKAKPAGAAKPAYQTKLLGTWLFTYLDLEPSEGVESTASVG